MQYFKSTQLYCKFLIARFDILVISEHSLFKEQLGMLESCTDNTYNSVAVSNNLPVLSGNLAHGGVALLWKRTLDDYISPLENISSDRIVGIHCNFPNKNLLFVLGVYLPSSNAKLEEFQEYLDHLWALYNSLSARGYVLILGDLNGDLENSLGGKGSYERNQRGLKLFDLVDFFNLCPVDLLGSCSGPLESYISHCGRYRSTIDYILLPNCLLDNIVDHLPIEVCLSYPDKSVDNATEDNIDISESKPKVRWYKCSSDEVDEKYSIPMTLPV